MSPLRAFTTCRARVGRAESHRKALIGIWNELIESEPYETGLDIDDRGTGRLFVTLRYDTFPPDFAIALGEMLYQLRAALDACIYGAAVHIFRKDPPPNYGNLGFPLCTTYKTFKKRAHNYNFLPKECIQIIRAVQPYKKVKIGPELKVQNFNHIFGILDDWSILDRHHRLHLFATYISEIQPLFNLPTGCSLGAVRLARDGILVAGKPVATFTLAGFVPGMKVQVNPNLAIDIALDKVRRPRATNDTFANRTRAMVFAVKCITRSIEDIVYKSGKGK